MRTRAFVKWTHLEEQTLIEKWKEGKSSGIISDEMGIGRGAVIGKLDRLGLLKSERRSVLRRERVPGGREPQYVRAYAPRRPVFKEEDAPESKQLTVFELTPKKCRWPYGDWDYKFCGHRVAEGSSYCAFHHHKSILKGK